MDIISVLSNPVRMRILQYLIGYGDGTTKQIAEYASNIPKPTLYRHINYLIENGIVIVKEERKVRGSVERLLSADPAKMYNEKDISGLAYQFLMGLYFSFYKYSQKPDADPVRDKLALSTANFNLTDEEMDSFINDISEIMKKYDEISTKSKGRLRNVSLILSPAEDGEESGIREEKEES